MTASAAKLAEFLHAHRRWALVTITATRGSTPRETGAWMLVAPDASLGTIGGGQLEYLAMARARDILEDHAAPTRLDVPLGPEIGQCCGGRVDLSIREGSQALGAELLGRLESGEAAHPHVYLFGGGHVGHALAQALVLLPVKVTMVETRAEALIDLPAGVRGRLTSVPEQIVREAPSGSAFAILTHDHALDFLIVAEALAHEDAAYVGMIGSKTKRATFRSWYLGTAGGSDEALGRLVSPIGKSHVEDKRPAVIAALATAEIAAALFGHSQAR
ncbi:MAG: xanthine dehydrogenase accessory protein XdhC [Methylobacterium mesophilicum]|nr:xanthine dehydrogenase accessory protein XdhC [Methylobacterium mesophilicum]